MHDAPSTALIVKRKPCQSRRESILVSRATGQPCQSVFRRGDTQATATPRSRVPTGKMDGCISIFAWNTARICNFQIYNRKKKEHRHAIHIGVLWCEMSQKLIQFPAIVSQYPFRFAMGAFGCKMGAAECKTGSLGAAVNFRFVLAQSCFVFTVRIFAKSSHLCSGPLEPCCSALCFLLPVSNKSSVFLLLL